MLQLPTTPSHSKFRFTNSAAYNPPMTSSPLAPSPSSSPMSIQHPSSSSFSMLSPMQVVPQTPVSARRAAPQKTPTQRQVSSRRVASSPFMTTASEESTRTLLMRERFRARCVERAQRERERNVQRARFGDSSDVGSSDVEMEDEEDDDCILSDELFRRIMTSNRHKERHNYHLSYTQDVGSSLDPDMEDVGRWEQELRQPTLEPTPEEVGYDDEDLAAYAEAYDDDWDEYADAVLDLTDADLARLAQDESNAMRASTPGMDMS